MRCDMVVAVSGTRQAGVGDASSMGHSLGQGVCWFPSGFAITAVSSRPAEVVSPGEKNMKSSLPSICTDCETALMRPGQSFEPLEPGIRRAESSSVDSFRKKRERPRKIIADARQWLFRCLAGNQPGSSVLQVNLFLSGSFPSAASVPHRSVFPKVPLPQCVGEVISWVICCS
jgi:hypothetical protein